VVNVYDTFGYVLILGEEIRGLFSVKNGFIYRYVCKKNLFFLEYNPSHPIETQFPIIAIMSVVYFP